MEKIKVAFNNPNFLIFIDKIDSKDNNLNRKILFANETACKKLDYTFEELILLQFTDLFFPINALNFKNEIDRYELNMDEKVNNPMFLLTKDGKMMLVDVNSEEIDYNNKKGTLTIVEEIKNLDIIKKVLINPNSESKNKTTETKEQFFQREKLATLGKMITGIAHEINNPLGFICSNIETAQLYFESLKKLLVCSNQLFSNATDLSVDEINERIEQVIQVKNEINLEFMLDDLEYLFKDVTDGLTSISQIVSSLKTFSRIDSSFEFKEYDLNNGIKESLIIARNAIKYYSQTEELYGTIPNIIASGNRINEAILNILLNSCYAIKSKDAKEKGLIKITTYVEDEYVVCEIEDNGTGIKQADIDKIFDDFFTTKPVGIGTGLGLSIVYDTIVNKHIGKINIESTFGVGTKITFKLPFNQMDN